MITLYFLQQVENLTNNYAYKDWVLEKTSTDRDVNLKTKNYLSHCSGWTDGV